MNNFSLGDLIKKTLVREKSVALNVLIVYKWHNTLTEIELKIGPIPRSGSSSTLQSLEPISSVSEYLYHVEWTSPFRRQLILQLIGVSFPHYQVGDLELPGFQLGPLFILYPSLQSFDFDVRLLSHLVK